MVFLYYSPFPSCLVCCLHHHCATRHYQEDICVCVCVNFQLSYTMGYCAEIREIDLEIPVINVY